MVRGPRKSVGREGVLAEYIDTIRDDAEDFEQFPIRRLPLIFDFVRSGSSSVMATASYDHHGVRFEYPSGWEIEVSEDEAVTTVSLQSPGRPAFVLVTLDESMPEPEVVVGEVIDTMREEYPDLDDSPIREKIHGYEAIGHDLDFFSLDITSACVIRCFRTKLRTVLLFGQWSDYEEEAARAALKGLQRSLEVRDES